jgi:hypothetical protein
VGRVRKGKEAVHLEAPAVKRQPRREAGKRKATGLFREVAGLLQVGLLKPFRREGD